MKFSSTADIWLSGILGRPCFSVRHVSGGLSADQLVAGYAKPGTFAAAKVPAIETAASLELQKAGFRHIEMALTLDWLHPAVDFELSRVRFSVASDVGSVAAIAESAFRYSRFHMDAAIPNTLADKVKRAWAENYFSGKRGDAMIVAEADGQVAGFLQLLRGQNGAVVIDLVAVHPSAARRGLAREMIGLAATQGIGAGAPERLSVGTQACNVASVDLYESMGFRLAGAQHVLHFHGPMPSEFRAGQAL